MRPFSTRHCKMAERLLHSLTKILAVAKYLYWVALVSFSRRAAYAENRSSKRTVTIQGLGRIPNMRTPEQETPASHNLNTSPLQGNPSMLIHATPQI